jgi:hypothetical protein
MIKPHEHIWYIFLQLHKYLLLCVCVCVCVCVCDGDGTQGLMSARQVLYHMAISSALMFFLIGQKLSHSVIKPKI